MTSSDEQRREQEQKYFEKLNISVLTISRIKEIIKNEIKLTIKAWEKGNDVEKQCFHIIGPAGVGKTQICFQIAQELSEELFNSEKEIGLIMVKSPVLSRDDFIIPFPIIKDNEESFKMLYSDFVPKEPDSYGIFVIDEMSRGDHPLQQLMWQIQNEYKVHLKDFPKGWFVITIDNPDDREYQMETLEDAAGLRRQLHIYTEVDAKDFLNHAIKHKFHQFVIEFIQTHPDYLYDFRSQRLGAVYANPASWEKVSNHLYKYEEASGGIFGNIGLLDALFSGLLNVNMTRMFIDFMQDNKDINPKDVFFSYPKVRSQVEAFVKTNNNAKLGELINAFCTFLATSRPQYSDKELKNVASFLVTIPVDTAALFVTQIDNFARTSEEFKYITTMHTKLLKSSKEYKRDFYDTMVTMGKDT